MNILFIGDVFAEAGRKYVTENLKSIKKRENIDFCIANCENASHGRGLSKRNYRELADAGIDVITMGNHVWSNSEFTEVLRDRSTKAIRPANIGRNVPGRGYSVNYVNGRRVAVINLEGRSFIDLVGDNPFECMDALLAKIDAEVVIVDFHAEASSEKKTLALYLDGRVNAVVGTHTHVPTADTMILPRGTAYVTDVGMTGIMRESVIGMAFEGPYRKTAQGLPARFEPCEEGTSELGAVIISVDDNTGKTLEIKRIFG